MALSREALNARAAGYRAKNRAVINAKQKAKRAKATQDRLAAAPKCKTCAKPLAAQNKIGYCYPHGKEARWQAYYEKNKQELFKKCSIRASARKLVDPAYRACCNVRSRMLSLLRGRPRYSKSLGCTQAEFKAHLENQFQSGMTWENYGAWHIDHIYPLARAYEEGPDAFAKACHFTNLQPLWAADNFAKSDSLPSKVA